MSCQVPGHFSEERWTPAIYEQSWEEEEAIPTLLLRKSLARSVLEYEGMRDSHTPTPGVAGQKQTGSKKGGFVRKTVDIGMNIENPFAGANERDVCFFGMFSSSYFTERWHCYALPVACHLTDAWDIWGGCLRLAWRTVTERGGRDCGNKDSSELPAEASQEGQSGCDFFVPGDCPNTWCLVFPRWPMINKKLKSKTRGSLSPSWVVALKELAKKQQEKQEKEEESAAASKIQARYRGKKAGKDSLLLSR